MILTVYALLVGIALVLAFLGYYADTMVYSVAGFGFLFFLGLLLMNGVVEVAAGSNLNQSYTYINGSVSSVNETSILTFSPVNSTSTQWYGRFLMFASILGFAAVITNQRGKKLSEENK